MLKNVNEIICSMSPARQEKISARAKLMIQQELTLRELRKSMQLTQEELAQMLGISQDGVSRLEKRSDLLISTLRKVIEGLGGRLTIVAELPNRDPIILSGFEDLHS